MGGHGPSVTVSTWKPGTGLPKHGVPGPGEWAPPSLSSPSWNPSSPSRAILAGPHTWLWAALLPLVLAVTRLPPLGGSA